jgi:hypothetical protein
LWPAEKTVCLFISHKLLDVGVPAQWSPKTTGDVAQVAGGGRAMLTFGIRDRLSASRDTVEEVTHVIHNRLNLTISLWPVEIIEFVESERVTWQWFLSQLVDGNPS